MWTRFLVAVAMVAPVACGAPPPPGDQDTPLEVANVNSRYTVESVSLSGWKNRPISSSLRSEIDGIVGEKFDHPRLELLAKHIQRELHVADVTVKVAKGSAPDHVMVTFEVTKGLEQNFDLRVAKFLYDSKQGWSGEGSAATHVGGNTFRFGLISDGDSLLERYSGIRAGFQRQPAGPDRLAIRFEFDSYHEQWNNSTLQAAGASLLPAASAATQAPAGGGTLIYRSRQIFLPEATLILADPLELDFGARFSRYRLSTPASRTESSNAVVTTLRYHPRWGSADDPKRPDAPGNEVDAAYSLEVATRLFDSDPVYSRHFLSAHYRWRRRHNFLEIGFLAGKIAGLAPLFDRFVLGNSATLRGWNKFDLDPLGGSHVVHGSIDYRYRLLQVFYDTGAIWDRPQEREQRQSLGVGCKKDGFQLALALPLRAGHPEPVFLAGMNF